MGRSQDQKREHYGKDSSDRPAGENENSDLKPKRTTSTAIAAPTGTQTVGQTLTAAAIPTFTGPSQGGAITTSRRWVNGENRAAIAGQTGATHVITAPSQTKRIRVQYLATNGFGTTVVESAPTGIIP